MLLTLGLLSPISQPSSSNSYSEQILQISAQKDWQRSNFYIYEGEKIEVIARNEKWSTGNGEMVGAEGTDKNTLYSDLGLSAPRGSLVAKINDNLPFLLGNSAEFIVENSGFLYFRIHDSNLDDNFGSITIKVTVWR